MDQRAQKIFEDALERDATSRDEYVRQACAGDAPLLREVKSLFAAYDGAGEFLRRPTGPATPRPSAASADTIAPSPQEAAGTRIGPYKLLQQIGEGGFGCVFIADQEKPIARRVALKIIKLGMDTRQVIARFEAERQALALMDHPNIARVLDGGATDAGRPYFVMELVKGEPITAYCDRNGVGIRERLELFVQVCQAVQHAHQKGIIHRDIKPSNILVAAKDGQPFAKVIDFGIAKATNSRLTEKTLFTEHRMLVGTPEYMSPEQAEGSLDVDTRTDVYSLGVLLYELLTGNTPFDALQLRSAAYAEIQRIIREVEPAKPSTRLSRAADTLPAVAARRRLEPRKLGMLIRGELDWIVMKALEKDRGRRYETANGLASDVRRYLAGEAVNAAPPGAAYRARKFVRRHRGAVIGAGFVVLALLLGLCGTLWMANEARRERDEQRRLAISETAARKKADQKTTETEQAKQLIREQAAQAERVSTLLTSRFLRPFPLGMTSKEVADAVQQEAEEVFGVGRPEVSAMLSAVGTVLSTDLTREREAAALLARAVEYQENSLGANDSSLVMPHLSMAAMTRAKDHPATIRHCRTVLRLTVEAHGDDSLAAANAREALALHLIIAQRRDQYAEVDALYQRAIGVYEKQLGPLHARTLDARMAQGQVLFSMNKYEEGAAMMLDAFEKARSVPDASPDIKFTTAHNLLAFYRMRKDKPRQVGMIKDLASTATDLLGAGSEAQKIILTRYSRDLRELGESAEADRLEATVRSSDGALSLAGRLKKAWGAFDNADFAKARDEAAALLQALPAAGPEAKPSDRYARFAVDRLRIESMGRAGEGAEAERQARELLAATESAHGPTHGCTLLARWTLAEALTAASQKEAGAELMNAVIRAALDRRPKDYFAAASMLMSLRDSLKDQGNVAGAASVAAQLQAMRDESMRQPSLGGFEGEDVGAPPSAWLLRRDMTTAGFLCVVTDTGARSGERCVWIGGFPGVDKALEEDRGFRNLMQTFDARPYRGKKVRFSAAVRLESTGGALAEARLWMRADRPNEATPHMFDNMGDKPITPGDWKVYAITGVVDADADAIFIGIMVFDEATACLDDVRFEVVEDADAKDKK